MKKVKRTYKVFSFKELKKDIKQKVLEELNYINVDYSWWDNDDIYYEIAKKYGLKIKMSGICFDLDRDNYCYFETYDHSQEKDYTKEIFIDNYDKFIKKAGLENDRRLSENDFYIDHKHYAGSVGENYIEGYDLFDKELLEKLENCLSDFIGEILSQLKKDYDYLTSEESVVETIEINEYEFLESGEIFV